MVVAEKRNERRTMECPQSHNLLTAVDQSENSRRAVDYLSRWVACMEGVQVTLLHVIKEPSRDVLPDEDEREEYIGQKEAAAESLLSRCREELESRGIPPEKIQTSVLNCCAPDTVVETILGEAETGGYDTIVLGRRGMSKKEEYIFGSVTSRIVREVAHATVWVVA